MNKEFHIWSVIREIHYKKRRLKLHIKSYKFNKISTRKNYQRIFYELTAKVFVFKFTVC